MSAITDALAKSRHKDEIVYHLLVYKKSNDAAHLQQAKNKLESFAKSFNVIINKRSFAPNLCLETALIDFVINEIGYNKTIPQLHFQICRAI